MRPCALFLLLILLIAGGATAGREEVQLLHKAVAGQTITYRNTGSFSAELGGSKLSAELIMLQRDRIVAVAASGEITRESRIEDVSATINGQKMEGPDALLKRVETTVVRPDGTLVSVRSEGGDEDDAKESRRLEQAMQVVFPPRAVGAGDRWSHDYREDEPKGSVAGRAEYELVGFESLKGVDTARLKLRYRESAGERKMESAGEIWVERASGDTVVADLKIENLPFGNAGAGIPPINGSIRRERTGGSPLGAAPASQPVAAPEKKKEKTIEEVVKDYEKQAGLFILYRKREAGRETLYLEVREDQLDRLLLLQVTASRGAGSVLLAPGSPVTDVPFRLVRRDEQVLFVVPNLRFQAGERNPIARAVRRSFPDAYLDAYKIEARSEERKSLLVNISDLFRSDLSQLTQLAMAAGGGSYTIDREKTAYTSIKVLPANLQVQTAYHLSRSAASPLSILGLSSGSVLADPRSLPLLVNYNLFFLPDDGYRPRLADPRVGYFTVDCQDFSDEREDQTRRYITRWRLEKADPNAALSPPKEPIGFWLDSAIPPDYREAVRRGLLLWNRAFERLGLRDAIVVKQMPDDADWDHADARYNVVRWVTSPQSAYAIAQMRVHPLTGQVLNAGITVDANLTRVTRVEFQRQVDPLAPPGAYGPLSPDPRRCSYAEEALPQAWLGLMALRHLPATNATRADERRFVEDFLTGIIAHEMGHILGLRHNFVASTLNGLRELSTGERTRSAGICASVMDYIPYNAMALRAPGCEYWQTTVGPYDLWAIEYGYTPVDAPTPEAERKQLAAIGARCNEPGLAYQSDEVADDWDPLVTRFDLGANPLDYWSVMFRDMRTLLQSLPERLPEKGENYWQLTRAFNRVLGHYTQATTSVARYVGGLRFVRNHRGDAAERPPLAPVSAGDQRRALELLRRYVFARDALRLPPGLAQKLAPNPYPDLAAVLTGGLRQDVPLRDSLGGLQRAALARLLSPATLGCMSNNEFKVADPKATLGLPTLFDTLERAIWEEVRTMAPVDGLRRQLQRAHLQLLADMVVRPQPGTPDDARMLARYNLRRLRTPLAAARKRARDTYTRVHYAEALDQIAQTFDAKLAVGAGALGR